jgi:omega-6 fatty acid desaturase (delta-12 desaturase)
MTEQLLAEDTETRAPRAGSLKPVIDIIPEAAYERPTWKGLFYFGRDLACYFALLTALVFFANPLIVLPLEAVLALVVTGLFVIGHDAAHGALFSSKRLNNIVGRLAMLPSWHVYEGWVLGHNRLHHPYTVRQGYDFVWHPYTPEQYAAMSWSAKLRHRLEWSFLGAGPYYLREVWWHKMMVGKPPARWQRTIRLDRLFVTAFVVAFGTALGFLGWSDTHSIAGTAWLIARVEVIPFLTFCSMIGTLVHVHHVQPTIRWWKRGEWTKFRGQMEGTTVLRVPKGMNFFLHWIMVHTPHHVDMRIPMYNLELAARAIEEHFPETVHDEKMRFSDFRANTKICKLYDFETGTWLPYSAARNLETAQEPETTTV